MFVFIPMLAESDMFRFRNGKDYADTAILKCALTLKSEVDSRGQIFVHFKIFGLNSQNRGYKNKKKRETYVIKDYMW